MRKREPIAHFTVRIPESLHKQAKEAADEEFLSLNSWMLRMLTAKLAKRHATKGNAPAVGAAEASSAQ